MQHLPALPAVICVQVYSTSAIKACVVDDPEARFMGSEDVFTISSFGFLKGLVAASHLALPNNVEAAAFPPTSGGKPYFPWPPRPWPPTHSSKPCPFPATRSGWPTSLGASRPSAVPPPGSQNSTTFIVGTAVNTTSGLVQGHPALNTSEVSEYLDISLAQPPLGNLRFAPPVRYYSAGNLSGLSTNKICPQANLAGGGSALNASAANATGGIPYFLEALAGLGQERSEDCLTINVWSKPQSGGAKKPVMVWIYGGGYATGSSNASAYSGQYFADQEDVVFVNFNYCLGVFGFSGAPPLTQNVGLLDQRMAVEWAFDNAAAFGGDASRIILFGESAGAASTDYYTYAWTEDPIIAGTISESGQVNSFGNKAPDQQASRWYELSTTLGCGNDTIFSPEQVVECMRDPTKVTTQALTDNSIGSGALSLILAQFGPTVDNRTVFSNYTQRVIDGDFIRKPYLLGSNDNEAGIFIVVFALFGIQQSEAAWNSLTESVFTCPANSAAYARWLHGVPVWRYRYFPLFPNINIPQANDRAYHLSEVFPLFNTDQDVSSQPSTLLEREIGGYLRRAWASFAHDPASALAEGGEFGWPQYSPDLNATEGLVLLGYENHTTADFSARGLYDGPACTNFYQGISGF